MKVKNKNVLVYGMSSSGEWVSKLLLKLKANVYLYDDDCAKLKNRPFQNCFLVNALNETQIIEFDFIVVSPAVEKDNEYLVLARNHSIRIFSEVEFASQFCKDFIAITGTNGKTTTVELVARILNEKTKTIACGNNGYPLSRAVLNNKSELKVVEVSSFMLENSLDFSPHAVSILNIEPDHLIRHKTMIEYTNLKMSIFKNLKPTDYAVINLDMNIHPTCEHLSVTYSLKRLADVYIKDGYIYLHENQIIALNELKLKGKHNISNVMCAICFAYIYKVSIDKIRKVLLSFTPDQFRMEEVASINGIKFINDSKSTNIASTLACVNATKGAIILLLGGSKKALDYTKLFAKLSKRVKKIFVYGEIADDLIMSNTDFDIKKCDTLSQAFDEAVSVAMRSDNILLSPASASYDQFNSYIERGNMFNSKVRAYENRFKKK